MAIRRTRTPGGVSLCHGIPWSGRKPPTESMLIFLRAQILPVSFQIQGNCLSGAFPFFQNFSTFACRRRDRAAVVPCMVARFLAGRNARVPFRRCQAASRLAGAPPPDADAENERLVRSLLLKLTRVSSIGQRSRRQRRAVCLLGPWAREGCFPSVFQFPVLAPLLRGLHRDGHFPAQPRRDLRSFPRCSDI